MIKNLSPSRASQYKTCPKQFEFANVIKIKEPTNEVQAKGTTVHTALENLYDMKPDKRNRENLHNLFRTAWSKVRENDEHSKLFSTRDEERTWGLDALKLLDNYLALENPEEIEPLERERWVRGNILDLSLRGILDRMDKDADGNLIIVDYKSGKAPIAKYKEPRFFALKLYALLIKNELGITPSKLKLIYLKNSTIHTLDVNDKMLKEAKEEILDIWENIKNSFKEDNFPAIKNTLCDWCYYKPICPIYNQDAPDTTKLKEINKEIENLKETIQALDMFEDPKELPKTNSLYSLDKKEIQSSINKLTKEHEKLVSKTLETLGE